MSRDSGDIHDTSVTASGVLVKIRSRMLFFRVGNGLTCSRKKSVMRSRNCTEIYKWAKCERALDLWDHRLNSVKALLVPRSEKEWKLTKWVSKIIVAEVAKNCLKDKRVGWVTQWSWYSMSLYPFWNHARLSIWYLLKTLRLRRNSYNFGAILALLWESHHFLTNLVGQPILGDGPFRYFRAPRFQSLSFCVNKRARRCEQKNLSEVGQRFTLVARPLNLL
jgi:hypothetical protein